MNNREDDGGDDGEEYVFINYHFFGSMMCPTKRQKDSNLTIVQFIPVLIYTDLVYIIYVCMRGCPISEYF